MSLSCTRKLQLLRTCCRVLFGFLLFNAAAQVSWSAEILEKAVPKVCTGFRSVDNAWGIEPIYDYTEELVLCAPNHAIMGIQRPIGASSPPRVVRIRANCCPLPASDILTDEHVEVLGMCPSGYVVTGSQWRGYCVDDCRAYLRCTKINSERYQIVDVHSGTFWGIGSAVVLPWREKSYLRTGEIPVSIRHGVSRRTRWTWFNAGCIGSPIGSLYSGKKGKACFDNYFGLLTYRGISGDPLKGTAVPMFPECESLSDNFSADASCVSGGSK